MADAGSLLPRLAKSGQFSSWQHITPWRTWEALFVWSRYWGDFSSLHVGTRYSILDTGYWLSLGNGCPSQVTEGDNQWVDTLSRPRAGRTPMDVGRSTSAGVSRDVRETKSAWPSIWAIARIFFAGSCGSRTASTLFTMLNRGVCCWSAGGSSLANTWGSERLTM